jgi:hypothetical protein
MIQLRTISPWLKGGLAAAMVLGFIIAWFLLPPEPVTEIPVTVAEIKSSGPGAWLISRDAVAEASGHSGPFVIRLKHLRMESLPVEILDTRGSEVLVQTDMLNKGDVVVLQPDVLTAGQAAAPRSGLSEERLIGLVLEAGMAAAEAENLDESSRFISPDYHDRLGFTATLLRLLLKRAFKEFDEPRLELAEPPVIEVEGRRALVQARLRLSAVHGDGRNYLLGDREKPDTILLKLDKSINGWKVASLEGLRPLGFEETFFRILGAEIGLPLSGTEGEQRKRTCMPCRQRMVERFGPEH